VPRAMLGLFTTQVLSPSRVFSYVVRESTSCVSAMARRRCGTQPMGRATSARACKSSQQIILCEPSQSASCVTSHNCFLTGLSASSLCPLESKTEFKCYPPQKSSNVFSSHSEQMPKYSLWLTRAAKCKRQASPWPPSCFPSSILTVLLRALRLPFPLYGMHFP
jgi:hypothetical protein